MRNRISRLTAQFWIAVGLVGAMSQGVLAETVYDNSLFFSGNFYPSMREFGDEVHLDGTARVIKELRFEYYGSFPIGEERSARIRFYANDGEEIDVNTFAPKTLLYESDEFTVYPGYHTKILKDIYVKVPDFFTWTVQFYGTENLYNNRAGLVIYDPTLIGGSFTDFWMKRDGEWNLYVIIGGEPANFAARFEAMPEPGVNLQILRRIRNDYVHLLAKGPEGRRFYVSTSTDLVDWQPRQTNVISGGKAEMLLRTREISGETLFFKATLMPREPEMTVRRDEESGAPELRITGPEAELFVVDSSTNLVDWTPYYTNRFRFGTNVFVDKESHVAGGRFYKLRLKNKPPVRILVDTNLYEFGRYVRIIGPPGEDYKLMVSEDLIHWETLETNTFTFNEGKNDYLDENAVDAAQRFYRVILLDD
ncbi:MAG: hypothetical protein K9N48_04525 [Verrucomicrobia bacterium]|nr:hypothetical protein [Verrucomicrobiota bacterium]MCF7709418.1 hypothetical protein [Verrucomicrobiota bacterium]